MVLKDILYNAWKNEKRKSAIGFYWLESVFPAKFLLTQCILCYSSNIIAKIGIVSRENTVESSTLFVAKAISP